jgi:WD40-like Beta Propeller Repeat
VKEGVLVRSLFPFLVLIALTSTAHAAIVTVVHGNIVLNGKVITTGGHDSDPVLSPDGKHVVFERATGGPAPKDCSADLSTARATDLWTVGGDGKDARKLLGLHTDQNAERMVCAFGNKQFSSNGQLLYFETPAWAVSGAVHVYDFGSGRERFFLAGNGVTVLNACSDRQYRDDLVVAQHRYFAFGGSYDWLWLFSPAGKEIGPVGENDANVKDACG